MKITNLFAVPIAEFAMENSDAFCDELRALFLEKEKAGATYRNEIRRDTQKGALFESRFDLYDWPDPPIRRLRSFVHSRLSRVIEHLSDYSPAELQQLKFVYHAWFHITRKGGHQGIHNHANASWSGIFCIDPGDDVPDRPDSGIVYFHDPRSNGNYYEDAGNRRLKLPNKHGAFRVKHEKGKLTIFPSYLLHEIFPFFGERPRIIAPFNCWVRLEQQAPVRVRVRETIAPAG